MASTLKTTLPLTFGIELEAIFAFHESRLQNHLDKHHPDTKIVKDTHCNTEPGSTEQSDGYTSWSLQEADKNPTTQGPIDEHCGEVSRLRQYHEEPLELARNVICQATGNEGMRVHCTADYTKQADYSAWSISNDSSLNGLTKQALMEAFNDRIPTLEAANDWDSSGVELISPPYADIAHARDEISTILSSLRGTSSSDYGATVSTICGMHVHIGLPNNEPFTITTLQHLAYLLVVYEEEISQLHEPQRHQAAEEIITNRENFLHDGCAEPVERIIINPETGKRERKQFVPIFKPLEEIRASLFETVDAAPQPLERLLGFMGRHRAHIVNFSGLVREGRPNTVEFRQHAGTLDPQDVFWWVKFCTGLVQLAHRYTMTGEECPVSDWEDKIDIEDLFEAIQFPEEGKEYFRKRMETYTPNAPKRIGYWEEWVDWDAEYELSRCDSPIGNSW
ncbi:hypothetical protein H2201_000628 [Coniosporium apollinis]|uniref:Amidoligase enzyme n=1 Tax=Coniosporium apollinis TaxID=61459 RepID=A0ABQ9P7J1_9PEZI|nr:hypothetical protein H2201_000628 [Coniosporium apollinis]